MADIECDGCDLDPWAPPVHYGTCPLAECGVELVLGTVDPYGTACARQPGHDGPHEGPDPFGEKGYRVRWVGGGFCAGDRLPHSDIEWVAPDA